MKRIICLIATSAIIIFSALLSSAFTIQNNCTYQSADSSGSYIVQWNGSHADISRYTASYRSNYGLDLYYSVSAACAYHGKVILFCDDSSNNQLYVYVYDLDSDSLDSFGIYGAKLYGGIDFSCDDTAIYIESYQDNKELAAYSYHGVLLNRYRFKGEITDIFSGYYSGVYVTDSNTLYTLSGNTFTEIGAASITPPLSSADRNIIVSAFGTAYVINGDHTDLTFSVDTDYRAVSACVVGNILYYPYGSVIYGYDIHSGEKVCSYRASFNPSLLYANGNKIAVIHDHSFITVDSDDFTALNPPSGNVDIDRNTSDHGERSSNNRVHPNDNTMISSDIYSIDRENYYITGIPPETSVAEFKSNMQYEGYAVTVYRDNTLKKSGNVGTAMTAVFTSDSSRITFELGVTGDITGEGNRNSRDLNLLMDHLIGAADFNGVYTVAADISQDGVIDVRDLAILKRII